MKSIYYLFVILLILTGCQTSDLKHIDGNFSISYPNYFEIYDDHNTQALLALIIPKEDKEDNYSENFNIIVADIERIDFKSFVKSKERVIDSIAKLVKSEKLEEHKCFRFVFELTVNNLDLTFIQYFYNNSNKVYTLTFGCETKDYGRYKNDINRMFLSFKINR